MSERDLSYILKKLKEAKISNLLVIEVAMGFNYSYMSGFDDGYKKCRKGDKVMGEEVKVNPSINGTLITRENNDMSLSCRGTAIIKDSIVTYHDFKGMPRSNGDIWTGFYETMKLGDIVEQQQIDNMLKYNGRCNVLSSFTVD